MTTKYQCDKGHVFLFPVTTHSGSSDSKGVEFFWTETKACPMCQTTMITNLNISEFVEPEADITSVKSVPLEDVDTWLKEGYKVREMYAKNATLIKTEVPKP